jgi:predicted kinase
MSDTRKGMGINEDVSRGQFRAIFVTGGPGSGKDVVIREAVAESKIVELNVVQAQEYLGDKQKLSEQSKDYRREAIRNRGPLIINGPADDRDRIMWIKEELEDLGYGTMMVFVNTTNETSKERNSLLSRTMVESVRHDKWLRSQENTKYFNEVFSKFMIFDNTGEVKEEDIHDVYESTNIFLDSEIVGETAQEWLERRKSVDINRLFKEYRNVKKDNRFSESKTSPVSELFPGIQLQRKLNKRDNIKDDDIRATGGYTFKTYHEASQPVVKVQPEPKESNFRRDKEKEKLKRIVRAPSGAIKTQGVGPEFDTRQQGTVYPMSGLGDVTYREQKEFKDFRKHRNPVAHASQKVGPGSGKHKQKSKDAVRGEKHKKKQYHEAIDDPGANDMGVAGTLGGSTNKEPMQKISDTYGKIKLLRKNKNVKI